MNNWGPRKTRRKPLWKKSTLKCISWGFKNWSVHVHISCIPKVFPHKKHSKVYPYHNEKTTFRDRILKEAKNKGKLHTRKHSSDLQMYHKQPSCPWGSSGIKLENLMKWTPCQEYFTQSDFYSGFKEGYNDSQINNRLETLQTQR